jgi:hypothetical protein
MLSIRIISTNDQFTIKAAAIESRDIGKILCAMQGKNKQWGGKAYMKTR